MKAILKAILVILFLLCSTFAYGADTKISDLPEATAITTDDLFVIVDDPGGTPVTKKITSANLFGSVSMAAREIDGHTTSTDLTASDVSGTVITNYDQAASDVFLILPAAAAGYSFLATVATAQSNHWCVEAQASDKIYLIAAAGTISAGTDGDAVCMVAAQVGQQFACWTFKTGASAYDWACKAIAIGGSTFEAHASTE